jgi:hypothetical protein
METRLTQSRQKNSGNYIIRLHGGPTSGGGGCCVNGSPAGFSTNGNIINT